MCTSPNTLPNGQQTACRNCSECRNRAINDWVGRVLAETKTAMASHSVTLTYGRGANGDVDHLRAAVLTYSDVQKYLKLLRRHGYPVRYLVAGEYGSKKGRAHWHIMLFWQKAVPDHVLDQNFMEQHWPHGFSFWQDPGPHAVRYICKYLQKDQSDQERQAHLAMSKKPPIGSAYFQQLAEKYVEQGLAPQSLQYTFPEARYRDKSGVWKFVPFLLRGRSAELYLGHYIASWQAAHGDAKMPKSELVELFMEYGKVVHDEWAMLVAKHFPKGEGIQPMPSRAERFQMADEARAEIEIKRAQHGRDRAELARENWWKQWVKESPNEQERQKRQAERDRHEAEQASADSAEAHRIQRYWQEFFAEQDANSTNGAKPDPDRPAEGA